MTRYGFDRDVHLRCKALNTCVRNVGINTEMLHLNLTVLIISLEIHNIVNIVIFIFWRRRRTIFITAANDLLKSGLD